MGLLIFGQLHIDVGAFNVTVIVVGSGISVYLCFASC